MRDHWRGPGRRPPWWPENEPFPPRRPGGWGAGRPRFPRRVGIVFALFFGLALLASGLAARLLWGGFGPGGGHRGGPWAPAPVLVLGLLVAALVAGRAVRRMAAPIGDVMEAAGRVAGGDYEARVEARGPGEVRRLASSFNQMAERLQLHEARRRSLLADVAHEMRTPLSVIRGNVEGMLDGLYPADEAHLGPVLEETAVMSRLLDDLQTLSTAEAGVLRLHRERVDPAALVEDAVAAVRDRADRAGVTLGWRAAPGVGDVVAVEPSAAGVCVAVSDTGSGIGAGDLPYVFDRFVKSADSGGAGLGLAIAKRLVEAHGGEISAESEPGGGTTMRLVLPREGGPVSPRGGGSATGRS